jgi:hypothetical protein
MEFAITAERLMTPTGDFTGRSLFFSENHHGVSAATPT